VRHAPAGDDDPRAFQRSAAVGGHHAAGDGRGPRRDRPIPSSEVCATAAAAAGAAAATPTRGLLAGGGWLLLSLRRGLLCKQNRRRQRDAGERDASKGSE